MMCSRSDNLTLLLTCILLGALTACSESPLVGTRPLAVQTDRLGESLSVVSQTVSNEPAAAVISLPDRRVIASILGNMRVAGAGTTQEIGIDGQIYDAAIANGQLLFSTDNGIYELVDADISRSPLNEVFGQEAAREFLNYKNELWLASGGRLSVLLENEVVEITPGELPTTNATLATGLYAGTDAVWILSEGTLYAIFEAEGRTLAEVERQGTELANLRGTKDGSVWVIDGTQAMRLDRNGLWWASDLLGTVTHLEANQNSETVWLQTEDGLFAYETGTFYPVTGIPGDAELMSIDDDGRAIISSANGVQRVSTTQGVVVEGPYPGSDCGPTHRDQRCCPSSGSPRINGGHPRRYRREILFYRNDHAREADVHPRS